MNEGILKRAHILIEQGRFAEAEAELRKVLATDPDNGDLIILLSIALLEQKKHKESEELIRSGIAKQPGESFLLYLLAKLLLETEKVSEAEAVIRNAIQLDPYRSEYFSLLAAIYLSKKEWKSALQYANKGLEINPDNLTCLNIRSTAQIKLDDKEGAFETIREALYQDPENASTHASVGWAMLEKGDHKQALTHFTKSLQLSPGSEYAKAGLVEALKAKYFIYRIFLKYAFWIGNMKSGAQWAVIIGFYFGSKVIRSLATNYPVLKPVLYPLIVLYMLFAVSTWIINPLFNLLLRFNVHGKYALSKSEIISSNFVGMSLLVGLMGLLGYVITDVDVFLGIAVFGLTMMIPLAGMLNPSGMKAKSGLVAYTCILTGLGLIGIYCMLVNHPAFENISTIYLIGIIAYQWISNILISRS